MQSKIFIAGSGGLGAGKAVDPWTEAKPPRGDIIWGTVRGDVFRGRGVTGKETPGRGGTPRGVTYQNRHTSGAPHYIPSCLELR